MGEYAFGVALRHGRLPRQVALYVGADPLRMQNSVTGPGGVFHFQLVNIRELDGETLLSSANTGDNVVAILTRLGREPDAVRRILKRIARGDGEERDQALAEFFILAALRKLTGEVKREAGRMPIQEDIMDDEVLGPIFRQSHTRGQIEVLARQIEKRFGGMLPQIRERLSSLTADQLDAISLRVLDANRIEDLFVQ